MEEIFKCFMDDGLWAKNANIDNQHRDNQHEMAVVKVPIILYICFQHETIAINIFTKRLLMPWVGELGPPIIDFLSKSSGGCIFKQMLLLSLISSIIFLDLCTFGNT